MKGKERAGGEGEGGDGQVQAKEQADIGARHLARIHTAGVKRRPADGLKDGEEILRVRGAIVNNDERRWISKGK